VDPARPALEVAIRALARRDLTAAELSTRLERAGFDERARLEALERLREFHYVDDRRVARERARSLAERSASDAAIRAELIHRGVDEQTLECALAGLEPEQLRAQAVAERLGGGMRAARALARRGFSDDVIERIVGSCVAEGM
jgi:SOS response regulatory protein OraA/RecX